jgi:hypothetical protein
MRDDLVAAKIEVDPLLGTSSFGAAQEFAVKAARGIEIVDWEGEVKRRKAHSVGLTSYRGFR